MVGAARRTAGSLATLKPSGGVRVANYATGESSPCSVRSGSEAALTSVLVPAYSVEKLAFWRAAGSGGSAGSMII